MPLYFEDLSTGAAHKYPGTASPPNFLLAAAASRNFTRAIRGSTTSVSARMVSSGKAFSSSSCDSGTGVGAAAANMDLVTS